MKEAKERSPSKGPIFEASGKLDVIEMDGLFATVVREETPRGSGHCTIDLSGLTFMTPSGLTGIVQCAALLKKRGWNPSVRFPTNGAVAHYLRRMALKGALRGLARCVGSPRGTARFGQSNALVELTSIRDTADIDALLAELTGGVAAILEEQLDYSGSDVGNFCNVISELSRNIIDHSESVGVVAAQRYSANDGRKFALVSVGDIGVGLRATLAERYPVATWSDSDVIIRALLPEYSRHPDRGLGLSFVKKICQDYQGSLHIRSGSCRIYIRGRRITRVDADWFPGTQVSISLLQKVK